jgi:predicted nucleic acid-binding protein
VVDANILFAALIKNGTCRDLLLKKDFLFVSPDYIMEEIIEHSQELSKKSGLSQNLIKIKLKELLNLSGIILFEDFKFSNFMSLAEKITPDYEDTKYFALALKLNCPIWSEDKILKKQKTITILSTKELLELKIKKNKIF